jgi:Tol biopolymer transport system component
VKRIVTWVGTDAGDEPMPFSWSPDGRRLAVALCWLVGPGSHGEFDCRIVVASVNGRSRRSTFRQAMINDIAWSPARAEIAFSGSLRSGPGEAEYVANSAGLYVVQMQTGKLTRVARGDIRRFAWSPNRRWLAYTRWSGLSGVTLVPASDASTRSSVRQATWTTATLHGRLTGGSLRPRARMACGSSTREQAT